MYKILIKIRSAVLVYLTHQMALPILKMVRQPEIFPYTQAQLQHFEPGTIGRDLVNFIEEKQLQLLPYYARHDMKHILLGYDTTAEGEVCLQMFMLGNRHASFPVLATVVFGLVTMPEHWTKFRSAYQRGRASLPIKDWQWFKLLTENTNVLKQQINGRNNTAL
jgi:ubiquinone biosynthesis protein Coq4